MSFIYIGALYMGISVKQVRQARAFASGYFLEKTQIYGAFGAFGSVGLRAAIYSLGDLPTSALNTEEK